MAKIFYARDGSGDTRASQGKFYETSKVVNLLGKYEVLFFQDPPPPFGTNEKLSDFSDYHHVVVSIDADEVCSTYPKEGYYFIKNLTAKDCEKVFNPDVPTE